MEVGSVIRGQDNFTEVLNQWVVSNDLDSANQLRSMVYYHLKHIVKKQIRGVKRVQSGTILYPYRSFCSLDDSR